MYGLAGARCACSYLLSAQEQLKKLLNKPPNTYINLHPNFADTGLLASGQRSEKLFPHISDYAAIHYLINHESFHSIIQNRLQ